MVPLKPLQTYYYRACSTSSGITIARSRKPKCVFLHSNGSPNPGHTNTLQHSMFNRNGQCLRNSNRKHEAMSSLTGIFMSVLAAGGFASIDFSPFQLWVAITLGRELASYLIVCYTINNKNSTVFFPLHSRSQRRLNDRAFHFRHSLVGGSTRRIRHKPP